MGKIEDTASTFLIAAVIIIALIVIVIYIIFYAAVIVGCLGAIWGSLISTRNFIAALKNNLFKRPTMIS